MEYLKILGSGSALPVVNRNPSSQVLFNQNQFFLIDCGEGTQLSLRKHKISFAKINHIFISHLHGDHYFGLPGLLSSFHLLGRKKELHLYGPPALMDILNLNFKHSYTQLGYELIFHSTLGKTKKLLYEDKGITVYSFPLNHRITCHGFLFEEKPKPRKLSQTAIDKYQIPPESRKLIKLGNDYCNGEISISNDLLTESNPSKPVSYAYCSDNRIKTILASFLKGVTFLYHETTFLEAEKSRAKATFHSTTKEAATLAKLLKVNLLIMGHYSARYPNTSPLLEEAKSIFEHSILGEDGLEVNFKSK